MSRAVVLAGLLALITSSGLADDRAPNPVSVSRTSSALDARTLATHWQLSPAEVRRVQTLVGIERTWSDIERLTPYELLGKHARTTAERDRYARRFAEAQMADHRRGVDWLLAVRSAQQREQARLAIATPGVLAYLESIDLPPAVIPGWDGASSVAAPRLSDRLHVFVESDACTRCSAAFARAQRLVDRGRYGGVDVVFADMAREDRATATRWAIAHGVTPAMIESERVTLNWEDDEWASERDARAVPLVVSARTGELLEE